MYCLWSPLSDFFNCHAHLKRRTFLMHFPPCKQRLLARPTWIPCLLEWTQFSVAAGTHIWMTYKPLLTPFTKETSHKLTTCIENSHESWTHEKHKHWRSVQRSIHELDKRYIRRISENVCSKEKRLRGIRNGTTAMSSFSQGWFPTCEHLTLQVYAPSPLQTRAPSCAPVSWSSSQTYFLCVYRKNILSKWKATEQKEERSWVQSCTMAYKIQR